MPTSGTSRAAMGPDAETPRQHAEMGQDSSAAKVLRVLDAFVGPQALVGVSVVARRAGLPKSTAHRLLGILTDRGYVRRVGHRYCLANRVFEVGNQVTSCRPNGLRERAMPYLTELFFQTRQTVHLASLEGTEVLYLEKIFGHSSVRTDTAVGGRRPAHATALGKAMLAYSDEDVVQSTFEVPLDRFTPQTNIEYSRLERQLAAIRSVGFATDRDEYMTGLSCVAAPILDPRTGRAVAALSVSTSSSPDFVRRYGKAVVETASAVSQRGRQVAGPSAA